MTSDLYNFLACFFLVQILSSDQQNLDERDHQFWYKAAQREIEKRIESTKRTFGANPLNNRKPRNVVFFLGDGMGMSTITATRILLGKKTKGSGLSGSLSFDTFPHVSLSKVNAFNSIVADSANSATAYLSGVKGNKDTIGVSARVKYNDCTSSLDPSTHTTTLFDWAQAAGKLTGFVTTTRITHATPAGLYAHTAHRKWEASAPGQCVDIAKQLIHGMCGKNLRVMFGGGRSVFLPSCKTCKEKGKRTDQKNLIEEWLADKKSQKAAYISTKEELDKLNAKDTDFALGIFANDHLEYTLKKKPDSTEPSLTEMTIKAIQILQSKGKDYFLFVEGGRIDHGHHENRAHLALGEATELEKTIAAVVNLVNLDDTLVLVTADHSHSLTINGYGTPEEGILGFAEQSPALYTTLMYSTGPGQRSPDLTKETNTKDINFQQKATVFTPQAAHSGEDVPVFANGAGSFIFSGVYDQTYIPHAIAYVTGIKSLSKNTVLQKDTPEQKDATVPCESNAVKHHLSHFTLFALLTLYQNQKAFTL